MHVAPFALLIQLAPDCGSPANRESAIHGADQLPVQRQRGVSARCLSLARGVLNPVFRAVPLVGREPDLKFLHDWLSAKPKVAVTAMVGAGGSGKTRLALEFLQQLPDEGRGGFFPHRRRPPDLSKGRI
jgi:hypothetical protein